jgi:hypothetical protein
MAITTSQLLRRASSSAAARSFLASSSVIAGFIRIIVLRLAIIVRMQKRRVKALLPERQGNRVKKFVTKG